MRRVSFFWRLSEGRANWVLNAGVECGILEVDYITRLFDGLPTLLVLMMVEAGVTTLIETQWGEDDLRV